MEHRTRAPTRIEAAPSAPAARTARGRATATRAAAYLRRLNGFIRESVTLERAEEPLASGEFAAATLYITSSRSFPCGLCGKRPRSSLSPSRWASRHESRSGAVRRLLVHKCFPTCFCILHKHQPGRIANSSSLPGTQHRSFLGGHAHISAGCDHRPNRRTAAGAGRRSPSW
eukprot:scaffold1666_cov424-Prasinococcus_capsulatus_cf.AAC.8